MQIERARPAATQPQATTIGPHGTQTPPQTIQGSAPAYQLVSDYQYGEVLSVTTRSERVISLSLPVQLRRRKIYCWVWANNSQTDFYIDARIIFWRNNSKLGSLPISLAQSQGGSTAVTRSRASIAVTQGAAVQDSLGLYVANPATGQPSTIIMQPLYIVGEIDEATISVDEIYKVTSARYYLGIVSSL